MLCPGYGIILAADSPVICCDLSTYGTYLCAESEVQMDYYFIAGKRPNTILNAYAYLCGRLWSIRGRARPSYGHSGQLPAGGILYSAPQKEATYPAS